ncbi:MAG: polysaccharide biosynthesis C-terminal domain-containing protein [Bacteroidota bacterium]
MIPYLQLLCVAGVLYPIHMVNVQALTAQGKVRLTFKLNLIKNGLRLINIFVMYPFGVIYIIIGEVILSFIALFINTYFTNKMVNYGFWKQAKDTWKIIAGGIVAGGIAFLPNLTTDSLPILLLTGVLLTLGIFAGSQYLFNRKLFLSTIQLKNNFKKL